MKPITPLFFTLCLLFVLLSAACDTRPRETPVGSPTASTPTQSAQQTPAVTSTIITTPTSVSPSSPTPAPTMPVPPAIRDLGKDVDAALQRRDSSFFRQRAITQPITCRAEDVPPRGSGGPECRTVGQKFDGFPVAHWLSEGAIVTVEDALAQIERLWKESLAREKDQFGDGSPKVYALGPSAVVLTALIERPQNFAGSGPLRVSLITHWRRENNLWQLVSITSAFVQGEHFLTPNPQAVQFLQGWERY